MLIHISGLSKVNQFYLEKDGKNRRKLGDEYTLIRTVGFRLLENMCMAGEAQLEQFANL